MSEIPETRFAPHGDSYIAYQVLGQGPPDIVFMRSAWNHVELQWEDPRMARLLARLASIGRLIVFDPRGSGLSDAFLDGGIPTVEDWADDTLSVMDAVGSGRAAVVCSGGGTTRAIPLAASHPERVISLVVCDGYARMTRAVDYPFGRTEEEVRQEASEMGATWGRTVPIQVVDGDPVLAAWAPRYRRYSTSPGLARKMLERLTSVDVRKLLSAVRVPTLVIAHADKGLLNTADHGRYLGKHIPGASYVELPGRALLEWRFPDPDAVAAEIERFLLGTQSVPEPDRVLATVLFTDIVASTQSTVAAGDRRWRDTLDASIDSWTARSDGSAVASSSQPAMVTSRRSTGRVARSDVRPPCAHAPTSSGSRFALVCIRARSRSAATTSEGSQSASLEGYVTPRTKVASSCLRSCRHLSRVLRSSSLTGASTSSKACRSDGVCTPSSRARRSAHKGALRKALWALRAFAQAKAA